MKEYHEDISTRYNIITQYIYVIYFMVVSLPALSTVHHLCARCQQRPEVGAGSFGNGITDG